MKGACDEWSFTRLEFDPNQARHVMVHESIDSQRLRPRPDEAYSLHQSHLPIDFRDAGIVVQLGLAYHELCDFSQALALYKKVRLSKVGRMDDRENC